MMPQHQHQQKQHASARGGRLRATEHASHHSRQRRRLNELSFTSDDCDEICMTMDPTCALYAQQCQFSDRGPNYATLCPYPPPTEVAALGYEACMAEVIMYDPWEGQEKRACGCMATSGGSDTCAWDEASDGKFDVETQDGKCAADFAGCTTDWGNCDEWNEPPHASWLYSDFLQSQEDSSYTFEVAWSNSSSHTYLVSDESLYTPILAGGHFILPSETTSGLVSRPLLLGSGSKFDMNGTDGVTEVLFTNVQVEAGSSCNFNAGSAVVMGGSNAGLVSASADDAIKLTGLSNTGDVVFKDNSVGILITDTENDGTVHLSNSKASVHGVLNRGTVTLDGGEYIYKGGSNEGTIVVDGGAVATYMADSNSGTLYMNSGSAAATIASNSGTIVIASGATGTLEVADNPGTISIADGATGTVTITGTNTGTVLYKGSAVSSDFSDGSVTIDFP